MEQPWTITVIVTLATALSALAVKLRSASNGGRSRKEEPTVTALQSVAKSLETVARGVEQLNERSIRLEERTTSVVKILERLEGTVAELQEQVRGMRGSK